MTERGPRLPYEILEQVVQELAFPCSIGDPSAQRTLSSLLLVSRAIRRYALRAKYSVVVAPRHVREFRRWIARESQDMIGINRALFVALDDVSKLTSTSAGWEADLQRLLQRLGPNLTHLSLWISETRGVLRDPAQIRGPRFRNRMPVHSLEDVHSSTMRRREKLERRLRKMHIDGSMSTIADKPLKIEKNRGEQQTRAEIAAARERARQKIPNWLEHELRTREEAEVKRRYKAHLGITVREYQHEIDVQKVSSEGSRSSTQNAVEHARPSSSSDELDSDNEGRDSSSTDSDDDHDLDWGCMPVKLSICPGLPLHEHENVLNFARMTIWTRVQELDIFVTVPAEVSRYLELFSSLVASPLVKFRMSSMYASLLIKTKQPGINIARGLGAIMSSTVLRSLLCHEFSNKHMEEVVILERALHSAIVAASKSRGHKESFDDALRKGGMLAASLDPTIGEDSTVAVKVLQGSQGHWGKLKDRRQDFLIRSLAISPDCWQDM